MLNQEPIPFDLNSPQPTAGYPAHNRRFTLSLYSDPIAYFAKRVEQLLQSVLHGKAPVLWTVELEGPWSKSLLAANREDTPIHLGHLLLNARSPEAEHLDCICLLLERGSHRQFLPDSSEILQEGDHLLFAGRGAARHEMLFTLSEPVALLSLAKGSPQPRGTIMRRLARRRTG